jgi:hypothetical protein
VRFMNRASTPIVDLIDEWYWGADYITGGAFHVVLDDYNCGAELINWCWDERRTYGCAPEHDDLMRAIRDALLELDEEGREAAVREAHEEMRRRGH